MRYKELFSVLSVSTPMDVSATDSGTSDGGEKGSGGYDHSKTTDLITQPAFLFK